MRKNLILLDWLLGGSAFPESLKSLFSVLWLGQVSGSTLIDQSGNGNNITVTGKDFATSYIPAASAATFALANSAPLKVDDDWDGLWFTDAGAVIQVTPTKLNNNDYVRTLVKYSDSSPYDIQWIGVLDDAATPTTDQWDQLHQYFRLGLFWSGSLNTSGYYKENRPMDGLGYKGWIAAVQALALAEPPLATKKSVNKFALEYRNIGVDTGIDRFYMLMLNDTAAIDGAGTVSLFGDRSVRMTFPVAPTKTASGIEGNGTTMYADCNFIPSTHGVNHTLNNASFSTFQYKIRTITPSFMAGNLVGGFVISANSTSTGLSRLNSTNNLTSGITYNTIDYITLDRNAAAGAGSMRVIRGTTVTSNDVASTGLPTASALLLRSISGYGDVGLSFAEFSKSYTTAEHALRRTAFLNHKTRLGL